MRTNLSPLRRVLPVALAAVIATAVPAVATPGDNVVLRWNSTLIEAVKAGHLGPPMVARAFAVLHTCVYDAWAAYDAVAVGTGVGGALRRPPAERTPANKAEALSHAAHMAAVDLYPEAAPAFDALMVELGYDPDARPKHATDPAAVGRRACGAVLRYRHRDGANQLGVLHPGAYSDYTGYTARNDPIRYDEYVPATVRDPDRYQPMIHPTAEGGVVTDGFLGAHWGQVRLHSVQAEPDAAEPAVQRSLLEHLRLTTSPGPARHGSDGYRRQAQELVDIGANLTDEQKTIAEFWADGPHTPTPAGHWMLLTQTVSRRDHNTLDTDARLFFAVSNSQADAAIASWYVKRHFDSVRPVTAVRYLFAGIPIRAWAGPNRGVATIDGSRWRPYQLDTFPTPPFAEYVAGHSTFSFAAATVLAAFTGSDQFGAATTIPRGSLTTERDLPAVDLTLRHDTFSQTAAQCGVSRQYGGIHFEDGDLHGRALGAAVGRISWLSSQRYFHGTR